MVVRRRLGAIYVGQKRFEDALKQFREIEKMDADPRDARTKIGLIYFEKGDVERAATEFSLVLASDPKNDRVRFYLGVAYAELGETSRALDELDKVDGKSDYYVEARVRRATILQKDEPAKAIKEIEAALAARPDSPELMSFLASLYREQKRYPKAVEMLERVVAQFPDNDRYRFTLGATYDEANDRDKAIEQMLRAIELNPKNAAALNYLGYTYADMGVKLDEAESLIRRALQIEPNDGFYIDSLGWVYFKRGDFAHAVEYLERAAELAGEDPTVVEHLGDAYHQTGRNDSALQSYRDALGQSKDAAQIERLKGKIQGLGDGIRAQTWPRS
jgi:tetratricopeptide (TPR) repeat protein